MARLVVAAALLAAAAACGSRRSHDELLADARVEADVDGTDGGAPSIDDPIASDGPSEAAADDGGSAPGGATDTTRPAAGPTTRTCTGEEAPLVVASVGQTSGVVGTAFAPSIKAVQAWVAATNAAGGLACHRVEYLVADDGGDPARQQSLVRQMVEQKGAVAILGPTASLTARASQPYLTERGIPVIGGISGPWMYDSPMYFPASAPVTGPRLVHATAEYLGTKGLTRVGVITCAESTDCAAAGGEYDRVGRQAGLEVVYNVRASALQPDYTSVCQAAQRAGAQALVTVMGSSSLTRLGQSCARVGYHPVQVAPDSVGQLEQASDPNVSPVGVVMPVVPWTVRSTEVDRFRAALERYAPGLAPSPASIQGWVWARLLEEAGKALAEPTAEAVLDGLYGLQGTDLGGLTVPLRFTRGKAPTPSPCWWLVEGADGRWTSPTDGRRSCA